MSDAVISLAPVEPRTSLDRRAVAAVVLGNALEFYDFISYAFLAKQIGEAYFPSDIPGSSLLSSLLVFWAGFFTRPIGAVVIGAYADRAGRKPAMLLTITLMALGILMVAATPGFATIGWAAPVIVVLGRLIQGFALGGEVGPTTAYLLEASPKAKRALYASWQLASQGVAQLFAGFVTLGLAASLSAAAMATWGWRVPFALGLLIVPIGLAIRNHLPETVERPEPVSTVAVLGELGRDHRRVVGLGILIIIAGTVATYVGVNMPTYANVTLGLSMKISAAATIALGVTSILFSLAGGWLADRFGRRPAMVVPGALVALTTVPAFVWLVHSPSAATVLTATVLISTLSSLSSAGAIAAIPESFPCGVRSAGLSIVYAVAVTMFGGSTQWVVNKLIIVTGDKLAPAYYLTVLSLVGAVAAFLMRETRGKALR